MSNKVSNIINNLKVRHFDAETISINDTYELYDIVDSERYKKAVVVKQNRDHRYVHSPFVFSSNPYLMTIHGESNLNRFNDQIAETNRQVLNLLLDEITIAERERELSQQRRQQIENNTEITRLRNENQHLREENKRLTIENETLKDDLREATKAVTLMHNMMKKYNLI